MLLENNTMSDFEERYNRLNSYIEEQKAECILSKWQQLYIDVEKVKYHCVTFIERNEEVKSRLLDEFCIDLEELSLELRYFWPSLEDIDKSKLTLVAKLNGRIRSLEAKGLRIRTMRNDYLLPHTTYLCSCTDL